MKIKNKDKIILDLCGGTGSWSKPYKDNGYTVINVTLPEYDVRLYVPPKNVYGILAAPPCTTFSFARTHAKTPRNLIKGMELVIACLNIIWECQCKIKKDTQKKSPLKFWALENPWGMLNWFLGYPVLVFHPYDYKDEYSKKTCLWGHFAIPYKTAFGIRRFDKKFDRLFMQELKEIKKEEIKSIGDIIWKDVNTRQILRGITPQGFATAFYEANQ